MPKEIEMLGKTFGLLTVIGSAKRQSVCRQFWYSVECSQCHAVKEKGGADIRNAVGYKRLGCWCKNGRYKHGLSKHPLYKVWEGMLRRCYNIAHDGFDRYGGRGITACDDWREDFTLFLAWALSKKWKKGRDLDRKDNDGNYDPDNCRFVSRTVNGNNKSNNRLLTVHGKTMTVAQAARRFGLLKTTIRARLDRGETGDRLVRATNGISRARILMEAKQRGWLDPASARKLRGELSDAHEELARVRLRVDAT